MTWVFSASYACLHCFFRSASLGFGVPLGTGVFCLAAMHFLKSGGSGTVVAAVAPVCWAWPAAAAFNQWVNSFLVISSSPTLATLLFGMPPPQPEAATVSAMRAAPAAGSARRLRFLDAVRVKIS